MLSLCEWFLVFEDYVRWRFWKYLIFYLWKKKKNFISITVKINLLKLSDHFFFYVYWNARSQKLKNHYIFTCEEQKKKQKKQKRFEKSENLCVRFLSIDDKKLIAFITIFWLNGEKFVEFYFYIKLNFQKYVKYENSKKKISTKIFLFSLFQFIIDNCGQRKKKRRIFEYSIIAWNMQDTWHEQDIFFIGNWKLYEKGLLTFSPIYAQFSVKS